VFSIVFTPPPLLSAMAAFGCYLSSLYSYLTRAGLPIHMIGGVSWEPKKKTSVGLSVFNSLIIKSLKLLHMSVIFWCKWSPEIVESSGPTEVRNKG
jgi:hypothetical protein